jgi:hypothetical protein
MMKLAQHVESRSVPEILTFSGIQYSLYLVRLFATGYFISMTVKYARLQGDRKDKYTINTFIFLGISTSVFLLHGVFVVTLKVLRVVDTEGDIVAWEVKNKDALIDIGAFMNIGVGYLCQNLAYLFNIQRWKLLVQGIQSH